jgi:alanine-glyoxylate transaminase/serine-glyoxylate transaminase/serine-pyruvate transaminase
MTENLLLIPGPTNLSERVRNVMSEPQMSHMGHDFYDAFKELVKLSRYAFKNEKGVQFVFTGSGTVGMESAIVSTVSHGDRVLVIVTGYFGKRLTLINKAHGAKVDELVYPDGGQATADDVRKKLRENKYKAVFMTHVETATSVKNPIEEMVKECRNAGVFSLVDAVCSLGGEPLDFDRLGADCVFSCSQKAIAGPPGAALLATSNDLTDYFSKRTDPIESYYMNLLSWKPIMDDPKIYLATPATQVLKAVREALLELKEEGLENRWARNAQLGKTARRRISELGLRFLPEERFMANTVTAFLVKDGTSASVQQMMGEKYGITVARGLGENKERLIRLGHFGILTVDALERAMDSLEEVLNDTGAIDTQRVPMAKQR